MSHQHLDWKQIKNNNFSNFKDMEKNGNNILFPEWFFGLRFGLGGQTYYYYY